MTKFYHKTVRGWSNRMDVKLMPTSTADASARRSIFTVPNEAAIMGHRASCQLAISDSSTPLAEQIGSFTHGVESGQNPPLVLPDSPLSACL
jgi:hypothetical protein